MSIAEFEEEIDGSSSQQQNGDQLQSDEDEDEDKAIPDDEAFSSDESQSLAGSDDTSSITGTDSMVATTSGGGGEADTLKPNTTPPSCDWSNTSLPTARKHLLDPVEPALSDSGGRASSRKRSKRRSRSVQPTSTSTSSSSVLPPDPSSSSTTALALGPVACSDGHDHEGHCYVDLEVGVSVDALFNLLFTDSHFFAAFCQSRATHNMVQSRWPSVINWPQSRVSSTKDEGASARVSRKLTYTVTTNNLLSPTCPTTEEQTIIVNQSKPSEAYVVDAKVTNTLPMVGECFHTTNRYCLTRVNALTCRLKVMSKVTFFKSTFLKSKILSSSKTGLKENFSQLSLALTKLAAKLTSDAERLSGGLDARSEETPTIPISDRAVMSETAVPAKTRLKTSPVVDAKRNGDVSTAAVTGASPATPIMMTTASRSPSTELKSPVAFVQPERAWFVLVILSLLLCLFLSTIYTRLIALEELSGRIHTAYLTTAARNQHPVGLGDFWLLRQAMIQQEAAADKDSSSIKVLTLSLVKTVERMEEVIGQLKLTLDLINNSIDSNEKSIAKNSPLPNTMEHEQSSINVEKESVPVN